MERILSQEEIAELLSAVRQGDIEPEPPTTKLPSAGKVTRLDLVRAHSSSQLKLNNLDLIIDAFARNYGVALTNRLQQPLSIKRTGIESAECEPLLQNLSAGSAIGVFKIEPFRGGGLLIFDPNLSFYLVELLLGGTSERQENKPDRPLTAIELNILKESIGDAAGELHRAFGGDKKVAISLLELQNNPRMVNLIQPEALTVVVSMAVDINGAKGTMKLVIPTVVLDPLRDQYQDKHSQHTAGDDSWAPLLRQKTRLIPLGISAELGQITLEMRDFLNFQVGDIIDLPWAPTDSLTVMVEGHPKFVGQAGVRNGNKAVRISGTYCDGAKNGN